MTERRTPRKKRLPAKKNTATRDLESPKRIETQELPVDEVTDLGEGTSVSANIGYSYQPFAVAKCTVHVTLGCSHDTPTMDRAAHIALQMARKYALDGMELIREDVESDRFHVPEEYRSS